ncbi:MAG: diaminopimelate epimerase [Christensenellaceae bacterium]|nr:diaminopimelate epimerase [Christensenellaceae bacterium]
MNGLGNDFILIDQTESPFPHNLIESAKLLCNRNYSIGADGLVIIDYSECADYKMQIFNSDGSEAAMCGNAIRCVGLYLYEEKNFKKEFACLQTLAGIKQIKPVFENGTIKSFVVNMGVPKLATMNSLITSLKLPGDIDVNLIKLVDVGNLHAVVFANFNGRSCFKQLAQDLSNIPFFKGTFNIEIVRVLDSNKIEALVYERGVGFTLACGTGAIAIAFAAVLNKLVNYPLIVSMDGGEFVVFNDGFNSFIEASCAFNYYGFVTI